MASALVHVKTEWRYFRHDRPGERFHNHHLRMQLRSRKHAAVALALGVLLLVVGVVLLFLPGPGTPLIVFGVGLIASHSKRLSQRLDRNEPRLREAAHRALAWWRARAWHHQAGLITSVIVVAGAFLLAIWQLIVVAYIL